MIVRVELRGRAITCGILLLMRNCIRGEGGRREERSGRHQQLLTGVSILATIGRTCPQSICAFLCLSCKLRIRSRNVHSSILFVALAFLVFFGVRLVFDSSQLAGHFLSFSHMRCNSRQMGTSRETRFW